MKFYSVITNSCLVLLMFMSSGARTDTLNIVAGLHKPPYVMQLDDEITGFEVELIAQVFGRMGHKCKFVLVPFARSMKMLEQPHVDAIMTASSEVFTDSKKITKPYITYQNVVVSLDRHKLPIKTVSDLSQYSIASFQMASKVLGKEFQVAASKSPYYTEVSTQVRQLEMLKQNKVDALVIDVNIFKYFNRHLNLKVKVDEVFPISKYGLALRDTSLIPEFEKQMQEFKMSDQYKRLLSKYNMI